MTVEALLFQSVIGPIGQPAQEAVYPAIVTIRRQADECEPRLCHSHGGRRNAPREGVLVVHASQGLDPSLFGAYDRKGPETEVPQGEAAK